MSKYYTFILCFFNQEGLHNSARFFTRSNLLFAPPNRRRGSLKMSLLYANRKISQKFWKKKLFWAHESTSEAPERKKVWRCKNVGFHIFSYIFHFWEKGNFLDWVECWNYVPAKPLPSEVSVWQTHERRGNFMKSVSHREMWTGEEINQTSPETNKSGGNIFWGRAETLFEWGSLSVTDTTSSPDIWDAIYLKISLTETGEREKLRENFLFYKKRRVPRGHVWKNPQNVIYFIS